MLEIFSNTNYLTILLISLTVFALLYWNPSFLQLNNYPNPSYYCLSILIIGTLLYLLLNNFSCKYTKFNYKIKINKNNDDNEIIQ